MKHPNYKIISIVLIFLLVITGPIARAQTAFLSMDHVTACPVADVTITLHAENLFNVGAITLYIGYDTTVLEYDGHGNVHPQFAGIISNAVTIPTTQVNIAWSSLTGGNITSGTLMELYFIYKGGTSELTFNPGADITGTNLLPIPFDSEDGSVSIQPFITENPQNTVVSAGVNASFSVSAIGAATYQWQENNGTGWQDLQNNATYQNVDGPELTIVGTPQSLDGYWYRCFLTDGGNCDATSDSAMLTVLPELTAMLVLQATGSCPGETVAVPMMGYALEDVIEFGFYISYLPTVATFSGLANVNPVIEGATATVYTTPVPHIQIAWSAAIGVNIPDGVLFELVFNYNQGTTPLIFMEQSFVLNSSLYSYNLSTLNGQIFGYSVPVIVSQPQNLTIYAGSDAQFAVQATGATRYQWFESQDNGSTWLPLQNVDPYSGVNTSELLITAVPVAFDQNRYKCLISSQHCDLLSEDALLTVDTVSSVINPKSNVTNTLSMISYQITGNSLNMTISSPSAGILDVRLYDLTGKLILQDQNNITGPGRRNLTFDLGDTKGSILLMQGILQDVNGNIFMITRKLLSAR